MPRKRRNAEQKLMDLRRALKEIRAYPPPGHPRRDKDGYPLELAYDEWAYRRMVDSFREAIDGALKASLKA